MKCYVCGKEYGGNACPVCEFEKLYVAGTKTEKEVKAALEPFVAKHREKFYPQVEVGIKLYRYTVSDDGKAVEESENVIFADFSLLNTGSIAWLDRTFDRTSEAKNVSVDLFVEVSGRHVRDFSLKAPQITGATTVSVGLRAENDTCVSIAVRDEKGTTVFSDPCPLFA